MAIGIIYIMTTSVNGLIKIGKTKDFNNRMLILEQNGYWNVSGLKRYYAVKVKDYDEKEKLIHTIFSKSQVANSELFALDKHIAKAMLESFEGEQVYPEIKNEIKPTSTRVSKPKAIVPDGIYYLEIKLKSWDNSIKGTMRVENNRFFVEKGSICCPVRGKGWTTTKIVDNYREQYKIENNILQEDIECNSPSLAAGFLTWRPENGWDVWKTKDGQSIDIFRKL